MKGLYSGRQPSYEPDPHAAVFIILSNRLRSYIIQVENESVIQSGWQSRRGNHCDKPPHVFNLVRYLNAREVDIGRWSTQIIGREQHPSLENEFTIIFRVGKTKQETFECIQSKVFGSCTPFAPRLSS